MLRIQFLPDLFIDNSYLVCVKVCVCKSTQNDRTVRRSEFDAWRHSKLSNHWLARVSCPPNLPRYSFAALRWQSVISYSNSSTTRAVWACCICRGLRFHVCFLLQFVSTMFGQYLCSKLSDCDCIRLHLLCVFHGTWSKLLFIVIFSAMQQFCSTTRAVWACCICRGLRFHVFFFFCFRSFQLFLGSICVQNCQTVTASGCIYYVFFMWHDRSCCSLLFFQPCSSSVPFPPEALTIWMVGSYTF